jgi:CelD/BcsL family acetyltransferase involved in cellulose biosynthesis
MLNVEEFNDFESLKKIRSEWNVLLSQTYNASFFQSYDWLEVYWKHYSENQKLKVLVISEDDAIIGIVPLVVKSVNTKIHNLNYLTYPLDDWGSVYGPVGAQPFTTLEAACNYIKKAKRDWDVFEFRWVDRNHHEAGVTKDALLSSGIGYYEKEWVDFARIELNDTYEDYSVGRSKSWRKNRRKNEDRVAAIGEVKFIRYRPEGENQSDSDPRWDLYDQCETIAGSSWQSDSKTGTTISDSSIREFMRDVHEVACKCGSADLSLLTVDDKPLSFYYGYHFQGYYDALRTGFDPSFDCSGAGSVILNRVIKDSYERGDKFIDMGPGSMDYKRRWYTSSVTSYKYTHFSSSSPRGQIINLHQWSKKVMSNS